MRGDTWPLFACPWPLRFADVPVDIDPRRDADRYLLAVELGVVRLRAKLRTIAAAAADVDEVRG